MIKLNIFPKLTDVQKSILIKTAESCNDLLKPDRFSHVYPEFSNIVDGITGIAVNNLLNDVSKKIQEEHNLATKFGLLVFKPRVTPSFFPPHNDKSRNLGINYVLKTGGNNVVTRFYKKIGSYTKDDAMCWNESSLEKTSEIICEEDSWYAFDAQTPHAVFNMTSTRVVLVCLLIDTYLDITFEEFQKILNTAIV